METVGGEGSETGLVVTKIKGKNRRPVSVAASLLAGKRGEQH